MFLLVIWTHDEELIYKRHNSFDIFGTGKQARAHPDATTGYIFFTFERLLSNSLILNVMFVESNL